MAVKHIPDGYYSVTPYLTVNDAVAAIEFYKKAFGAVELSRVAMPDGKIGHAEIRIGNSIIMLADAFPQYGNKGPDLLGGTCVSIALYVEDADEMTNAAVTAGAKVLSPITNQFYGDRSAKIQDPFGHVWHVATHIEDVSPAELKSRMDAWLAKNKM